MSSTFYDQLMHQYSFAKKIQSQTIIREMLRKALWYENVSSKMLMKLTPGDKKTVCASSS